MIKYSQKLNIYQYKSIEKKYKLKPKLQHKKWL